MTGRMLRVGALALAYVSACGAPDAIEVTTTAQNLGQTYQVGPTRAYTTLQQLLASVTLGPDDVVLVDYATPYPVGVVFTSSGSNGHPITIRGVPDAQGHRPVLKSGINAANQQNIVHFKYADYYVFENFEIDGSAAQGNGWAGNDPNITSDDRGTFRCVFHQGHGITIRNSYIHDCPAHGIASADDGSGSLTLEYSEVAHSGAADTRHPIYAETDPVAHPGAVFRMQHCFIHDANGGNLVKSRAERNEIYYNWLEQSPYRELELIGADSSDAPPRRMDSDVVGNVIYKTAVGFDAGAIRVGHDWTEPSGLPGSHGRYRFVANTIVMPSGLTGPVIKAEGAIESIEMHDNVFHAPGTALVILRDNASDAAQWTTGTREVAGSYNWVTSGSTVPAEWTNTLSGASPSFAGATDFHPGTASALVDAGAPSAPTFAAFPFPNPLYPPVYVPPSRVAVTAATARPADARLDIGAYEAGSGGGGGGGPPPGCQSAAPLTWIHGSYAAQTTTFTAEYDATPSVAPIDAVVGLSSGSQSAYTGLAAITRFSDTGFLDVRNGNTYGAVTQVAYAANTTYHFRVVVNLAAKTYSAYVRVGAGAEQTLATSYSFRTEQAAVAQLDSWNATTETAGSTVQVCNVTVTPSGGGSGLPAIYTDETNVTFTGGSAGDQAAIVAGQGIGGSNAIKHSNLQIWDGTKRLHLPSAVDISGVQSTDKLHISLDVSAGRASAIYIYFNDDWQTYVVTPVLDQVAGYQTFEIPLGAMRAQMGAAVNDIYFKAGDGFPDSGTLWVDDVKFVH
jgi:hypothetical protein